MRKRVQIISYQFELEWINDLFMHILMARPEMRLVIIPGQQAYWCSTKLLVWYDLDTTRLYIWMMADTERINTRKAENLQTSVFDAVRNICKWIRSSVTSWTILRSQNGICFLTITYIQRYNKTCWEIGEQLNKTGSRAVFLVNINYLIPQLINSSHNLIT